MRRANLWRDCRGATIIEAMAGFLLISVSAVGIFASIALSNWSSAESRSRLQANTLAVSEVEWLQAYCRDKIHLLLGSGPYDPEQEMACDNYPNGPWRDVAAKLGVPGMAFRAVVEPLPGEEENLNAAQVTVRVEWDRAYLMTARGSLTYVGYLAGSNISY